MSLTMPFKTLGCYLFDKQCILSVSFLVTSRCNFRCKYCNSYNQKEREMTTEQALKMIDELADIGVKRMGFTGGEPLLRNDIGKLIDEASKRGMKTTLFSNGSLVKSKIKELKNLDLLLLSLDGPKEIQDNIRMKGAYDAAMEALEIAREKNIKVWSNTVITKHSVNHIDFVLEKAKELGFSSMFMPVFEYSLTAGKEEIQRLSPDKKVFTQAIRKLIDYKKKGYPIINSKSYFEFLIDYWPNKYYKKCYAGKFFCAINSDGRVAPCHYLINSGKWPNGLEIGFKEAIRKATIRGCAGCYGNAYIDSNLFFSLNVETIRNAFRNYRF